jgi:hypothetical protein
MSRLDHMLRRLHAQRACLNRAAELVAGIDGVVLELGLGNGRSYDHLRELLLGRDIYVCEREVAAHPDCIPPDDRLLVGDLRETLPRARPWLSGKVALLNIDLGTGNAGEHKVIAAEVLPLAIPLLTPHCIIASDLELQSAELEGLPLPEAMPMGPVGRYQLYRRR